MSRSQAAIVLIAALFLALVFVTFFSGGEAKSTVRTAPDFRLPGLDGKERSLSAERGQPVLVNFWATWCPPCAEETPSLEALHKKLSKRGLRVFAVSVDDSQDPVRRFVEQYGVTYAVLLDPSGSTAHRYGTFKYPETYLVGRSGTIVKRWVGAVDWTSPEVADVVERELSSP